MTHNLNLDSAQQDNAIYNRVTWRIMPILFLSYVVSYLDRVNVGFAKLQMMADLNLSDTVYGLGAGIFFIGYFLFEIPSNLILHKVGARLWIARIMISWGVISGAMVFINSAPLFYLMRFLLGLAEAGFFPGVILYMTYWYPSVRRGRIYAVLMSAVAVSGVIGGPLSGWIMQITSGVFGMAGWQWMFVLEALPAMILGIIIFKALPDRIASVHWLGAEEKQILIGNLQQDELVKQKMDLAQVVRSAPVWHLTTIYFTLVMGLYGVSFWLPTMIKATGVRDILLVGVLTAIPYFAATLGMLFTGRSSDRHRERRWHLAVPMLLGGLGLLLSTLFHQNTALAMLWLTVALAGILGGIAVFWSLPTALLSDTGAALGIALINSMGNLAGFVSPFLIGWMKDLTHSTDAGMIMLTGALFIGAVLTLMVRPVDSIIADTVITG